MMSRNALLIGIPKYSFDAISPLLFIQDDIKLLQKALESSGYKVRSVGLDKNKPATPGIIRGEINEFCRSANTEDMLLLCYSGHGLHKDGIDYLVPYDARTDDTNIEPYLISLEEFSYVFENSRAKSILFFIDACREGLDLGEMGFISLKRWSKGKLQLSKEREVAFVFSCSPGEVSRFIATPEGFSLFSRALAETIDANNPARTFGEIISQVQTRLDELTVKYGKPRQKLRVRSESEINDDRLYNLEICKKENCNGPKIVPEGVNLIGNLDRSEQIRSILTGLSSKGALPSQIFIKSIHILDNVFENQDDDDVLYYSLFDLLLNEPPKKDQFIEEWYKIEYGNKEASAWNEKGNILDEQGKPKEAIRAYNKAIELDDKYACPWYNKGKVLEKQDKLNEAVMAYDKAIELDPRMGWPYYDKGIALKKLGRIAEGEAALIKSKELGFIGETKSQNCR